MAHTPEFTRDSEPHSKIDGHVIRNIIYMYGTILLVLLYNIYAKIIMFSCVQMKAI